MFSFCDRQTKGCTERWTKRSACIDFPSKVQKLQSSGWLQHCILQGFRVKHGCVAVAYYQCAKLTIFQDNMATKCCPGYTYSSFDSFDSPSS